MSSFRHLLEGITGDEPKSLVEAKKEDKKEDKKKDDDSTDDKDPKNFFDKFKKKKKDAVSEAEYISFLEQLIESAFDYDSESLQEAAIEYYDSL